jgi:hypothetical protein
MTGREGLRWRKASRSGNSGANCVEVAWRKASHSDNTGANCVEVVGDLSGWAVRDSKNTAGPVLVFGPAPFSAFLTGIGDLRITSA